jgi:diadenosine tetraphosphate (Ap4A) HIT family hydrolase
MNATLRRFGYPGSVIKEFVHWVVMVRPGQVTLGCAVIAARSECVSLADLTPGEAAELPQVIGEFERAVRRVAPAAKFNYLALMMVDPNPHFHAIPRYADKVHAVEAAFADHAFPNPPDLHSVHELTAEQLEGVRRLLEEHWQASPAPGAPQR